MTNHEYAVFKRCMEWYTVDPEMRECFERSSEEAVRRLGFYGVVDAEKTVEAIHRILFGKDALENPYIGEFLRRQETVRQRIDLMHVEDAFADQRVYAHEQRERRRASTESALLRAHRFVHYFPFAFELSEGCSVQCPFCGFSAKKHEEDFLYNDENAALFADVIRACVRIGGRVIGACPLYFATEPFDNPDYERFLGDFIRLTGSAPQTTTAIADRVPERVRLLMALVGEDMLECDAVLRFSIRTLGQFKRLMSLYTPDELIHVELLGNNPESANRYSDSGRIRGKCDAVKSVKYSICCVSGLKVNFVGRRIEFITPEIPDEEHPNGYSVKEVRTFEDGASFENACTELLKRYVFADFPTDKPMRLNKNTALLREEKRLVFKGDKVGYQLERNPYTEALAEAAEKGISYSETIAALGLLPENALALLSAASALYERGYIRF